MQRTMQRYASVFRTGEVLEQGTRKLDEVAGQPRARSASPTAR